MIKVWICGAGGQVGQAINAAVAPLEYEIFNTDMTDVDITDMKAVMAFVQVSRPDVIINCSGMTDMEACNDDPAQAFRVNALGARNLAIAASQMGSRLVQISSDDVFDGRALEPYNEFDHTKPLTVYGKSKLAGEQFVKEFCLRHFILRSTWIYGEGSNFVTNFLSYVEENEVASIASDQFGSPTSALELARFILALIKTNEYGTYHATCQGSCSRYAFAKEILRLTGKKGKIKAVPTHESEFSKVRPPYAVLNNFMLSLTDIYTFPHWKTALADYLEGEQR